MRALLDVYRAYFTIRFAVELQYRAALLIWQLAGILSMVIFFTIWSTAARSSGGSLSGFTAADFAAYYLGILVLGRLTHTYVMWEYEYRVRNGTLSAMLLRPVHPIHADMAENLMHNVLSFVAIIPVLIALSVVFEPALEPGLGHLITFVPALGLAIAIRFTMEWALALAAFWTTHVSAINQMYFVAMFFLSGQLAPLALLPEALQAATFALPFRWIIAFPAELLMGRLTAGEVMLGLAAQVLWLVIILRVLVWLWRTGVQRYGAVGA